MDQGEERGCPGSELTNGEPIQDMNTGGTLLSITQSLNTQEERIQGQVSRLGVSISKKYPINSFDQSTVQIV
jgi:hypothetical protein